MAALILAGAATVDMAFRRLGHDATVIDMAGRQRVLAQQIVADVLRVRDASDGAERRAARARLAAAWPRLTRYRAFLLDSAPGTFALSSRAFVERNAAAFSALQVAAMVAGDSTAGPDALRAAAAAVLANESAFLARLDSAVTALTTEATAHLAAARHFMYAVVGLVLVGLVAVGLLILRPAVQDIRLAVEQLRKANADLDVALEEARGVARAKSEFLATMSHELRTPLNAVIGLSGLLAETPLDARQRKFVSTVIHSGEALLGLINNILDLSKIDAGKLELEVLDFDIRELVETTAETLALLAEGRGVELATYISHDCPGVVRGDAGRVRQVLLNLLSNALKFTERGSVLVRVRPVDDTRLRIEVTDTGIGIPADRLDRLFAPFSQADASTTRRFGGTGLGLNISRRLVELMGGSIGVASTVGVGSTFHIELPLPAVDEAATGTHRALSTSVRGRRVLIVDDTDANRLVLRETLVAWGMVPVEATSSRQALDVLREAAGSAPFDLAILDWQMPDLDGYALAAEIRRDPAIASTPLILLSSFIHEADPDATRLARFAATLTKPVRHRPFLEAVLTALTGRDARPVSAGRGMSVGATTARWPGRRALVADDNPVNVLVLKAMLESYGLRVDVAADGQEVIEAVNRAPFDLVFMDVYMPGVDGLAAARAIRERERAAATRESGGSVAHVPVIACTASVTQDDRAACSAAGMDDYLTKPIARDALDATLRRWLGEPASE